MTRNLRIFGAAIVGIALLALFYLPFAIGIRALLLGSAC